MPLIAIEQERGQQQFELIFAVTDQREALVESILKVKKCIEMHAAVQSLRTSFAGKPVPDQPGSALHFHLDLMYEGENAFHKTDEWMSEPLRYALGGLLALTPHIMPLLAPNDADYLRYSDKEHVPSTVSWGHNNRSCAVRIPSTPAWEDKRLEWRVPAANADPDMVSALLLHAVSCGIEGRMEPPKQCYGIASRDTEAAKLPQNLDNAQKMMQSLPEGFAPLTPALLTSWLATK